MSGAKRGHSRTTSVKMQEVTGLIINGVPVGIENATIGFLIALTALLWTVAQHIQMRNHMRFKSWSSSAIQYLLKSTKPSYDEKGRGILKENPNKNLGENV